MKVSGLTDLFMDKNIVMPKEWAEQEKQKKWDLRFLELAEFISKWSKDPSTQVGCVITKGKKVVSIGYNGFPVGVEDRLEWLNDRPTKYSLTVHSEPNAIASAERPVTGCTIYTIPFPPCSACMGIILQNNIRRIVSWGDDIENPRWSESFKYSKLLCDQVGAELDLYYKKKD